jgi:creatinine amidohydrolase
MFICSCNWYQAVDGTLFENSGGHADEMETSMMQYIAPEMVLPLSEAGEGKGKKFRIKALNGSWAWAERKWSKVTSDTGIGNPYLATPEKGQKCFDDVVQKIGDFMLELCGADLEDMYE